MSVSPHCRGHSHGMSPGLGRAGQSPRQLLHLGDFMCKMSWPSERKLDKHFQMQSISDGSEYIQNKEQR